MNMWQIIAAMLVTYLIGYGHGHREGEVRIQANAPIACTTDGRVTTCQ